MGPLKMPDTENDRTEIARHENGRTEAKRKMHDTENGRKFTHWKMAENTWQKGKCTTRKMTENSHTGKWQKKHTWKMAERKMHDTENGRTNKHWKMAEQKMTKQFWLWVCFGFGFDHGIGFVLTREPVSIPGWVKFLREKLGVDGVSWYIGWLVLGHCPVTCIQKV